MMTVSPRGADYGVPASADAARILQEITPVTRRSRRLARDVTFARPLLAWGLAWTAGAIVFQFVSSHVLALFLGSRAAWPWPH